MVTFREAISQASEAAICSLLAGTEAASWLGGSLRIGGGPNAFAEAVRRARLGFCSNPDPDVDLPEPPFQGGQCPGVQYRLQYTIRQPSGGTSFVPNAVFFGPIGGVRVIPFFGAGQVVTTAAASASDPTPTEYPGTLTEDGSTIEGLTITRVDGQPDTCGDPESPPVPPYSPVTFTTNVTYEDNSQTTVTEEGDFVLLAPVIIGGNLIAPITVNLGGLEVPVEVNLSTGDITFDFGPNDTPTPVVDENPVENPTEDEPEIEEDRLVYGLVVYSSRVGSVADVTTLVAQQSAPDLRLPRTGNVYFQVPVGDRVSWLGPIPVQLENQLVRVPWGMGATGYRLVPNTGWTMTAVRLGKPPCGCSSA